MVEEIDMGIHATDDTNSDLRTPLRTRGSLRQLVGYAELIKAASVSRSTIERAWRGPWDPGEPQLPKPGKIGSRAVWSAADADAWLLSRLHWQRGMVATLARDNAEDLEPEQMEDQALQLILKSIELRTGQPVEFDALDIRVTRSVSEDELNEAVKQEFSL
ncbi:MAG: hypothetical protein HOO99_05550, partial [Hyphomicrobiaceae bacterium]|nr:hypothetical protein [Hyphomicrobiaceae bacterium]